jgi:hypothetical protein
MRLNIAPSRRKKLSYSLYAVCLGLLAGTLVFAATGSAQAVAPGTDWGPDGLMAPAGSAVTVAWDNSGSTPAEDQVARNSTQVLPHTGGKTYADANATVNHVVQRDFSGMKLTVSQTAGLEHQAVNLSLTGMTALGTSSSDSTNGLNVMQCWGSPGEAQPDPTHCQDGQGVVDSSNIDYSRGARISSEDGAVIAGGDLKANTSVALYGQITGTTATLTASVQANLSTGSKPATGATGQVEFDDGSGKAIATVPVSNSRAVTTVPAPSAGTTATYSAKYLASPNENYLSASGAGDPITLPNGVSTPPAPPTSGAGTNSSPDMTATMPFQGVDGSWGIASNYFSPTTTNELGDLVASPTAAGVKSKTFEIQTGAESSGLGCGLATAQPSTSVCWLVAVPVDNALGSFQVPSGADGLTPSLWAQRVQVKLNFAPVASSCGTGARQLAVGAELLVDAMNSWIPALCSQAGVDLGYIQTGDDQARSQYSNGQAPLIFTSSPVDDSSGGTSTLYAPAGLSAVTISVLSLQSKTQTVVTGLKLNARLVAKLLTESYQDAIESFGAHSSTAPQDLPWQSTLPQRIIEDPEFLALNPTVDPSEFLHSDIIVTVSGSDATNAVWNWLLSDPDAKAFLDGCPDAASNDSVINPFYSTRTYTECQSQKGALEAAASAERSPQSASNPNGTKLPSTWVDATPQYPPSGSAAPQPEYYERAPIVDGSGRVTQLADTFADLHPPETTFAATATDVFRGQEKTLSTWCNDPVVCGGIVITPPGVWINSSNPSYGSGVMGLTDGTAAARNLIPTTLLCDDSGANCVGANNDSLQKAASDFVPSSTSSHFLQPPTVPDYAGGAYPLTLPVYAEVNTQGLDRANATAYAKVLAYISTTGQQQGFAIGNLPPGMAPLTDALIAQTDSAISTLQQITDPTSAAGGGGSSSPNTDQLPPVGFVPTDTGSGSPSPSPTPQAMAGPIGITPVSAVGFLPYGVGTGLLGALGAGIAAPIVGRKRRS